MPGPWPRGRQRLRRRRSASRRIAPDLRAGAFFDVDNTLMRGASIYHFARGLAAHKMFGASDLVKMALGQVIFRIRGAENTDHIDAAREAALAFVAGHKVADISSLGEEIYDDTMADRIWEGSRQLTQAHLEAGQRVWLVTATPVELAEILARQARPDRRARHRRRSLRRRLHGPAGRRPAARRGEGGGRPGPCRARGPRPCRVQRVQRLDQRPADAEPGRAPECGQPRSSAQGAGHASGAGRFMISGRAAGPPSSRSRSPLAPA